MDAVQTDVAPSTTGLNDRNSKDVPTSRNGGRPQPPGQEREGSGDDGGGGGSTGKDNDNVEVYYCNFLEC